MGEWVRRCDQQNLADLGCPYDPLAGRIRCPGEKTLRDAYARVDPGELTRAGYQRLAALAETAAAGEASALTPGHARTRTAPGRARRPSRPAAPP